MAGKGTAPKRRKKIRLFDRSRKKKIGLPPGTPVHVGRAQAFVPEIHVISYNPESFEEKALATAEEIPKLARPDRVNWIDVEGVHDVSVVQQVASFADLHQLTVEDIVNTALRPQFESYPGYFFFAIKMLYLNQENQLTNEHLALVLKGNTIMTFQETPGDVFGRIRERIRSQTGKVRTKGADYLIYMLIDSVVDSYYQVVDHLGERIDALEEELRCGPRDQHLGRIFELRREILFLRKNIMPVRDLLNKVQVEGSVFQENTRIYLKDLADHVVQVTDSLNLSVEMANVLIDTYHSMQNQRLNAIMKTLTMISTVFLPLNFIAGIYGMNFHHMPELDWVYGYPLAIGAMVMVALLMIAFFVRKGWLLENLKRKRDLFFFFDSDDANETPQTSAAQASSTSR